MRVLRHHPQSLCTPVPELAGSQIEARVEDASCSAELRDRLLKAHELAAFEQQERKFHKERRE
jgi:hypothetical protein